MERAEREEKAPPPKDFGSLRNLIAAQHDRLPKRLAQVAAFMLDNPDEVALGTSARGVSPSRAGPAASSSSTRRSWLRRRAMVCSISSRLCRKWSTCWPSRAWAMLISEAVVATPYVYDYHFYHHVSEPYIRELRRRFMRRLVKEPPRFVIDVTAKPTVGGEDTTTEFPELSELIERRYSVAHAGDGFRILLMEEDVRAGSADPPAGIRDPAGET